MVLDYVSTNALEEIPTLNNYRKLTRWILFAQFIVSVIYHVGRTARVYGAGIDYGWTWKDYDDARKNSIESQFGMNDSKGKTYECDDFFNDHDNRSDYRYPSNLGISCPSSYDYWYPSYAGISFPWAGGIWFVLAVWTTALPQEPIICLGYTFLSLIIKIAVDIVNFWYHKPIIWFWANKDNVLTVLIGVFNGYQYGHTTYILVGFSFIIVLPCLSLIRQAFKNLEIATQEKELMNLRRITLNKIRIIFLFGLAQVYVSFPSYKHKLEQILGADENCKDTNLRLPTLEGEIDRMRHLIPTAAGGILNVTYVVSIIFIDVTKFNVVDFIKGNLYNLEGIITSLHLVGFALALALTRLKVPTKEEIVLDRPNGCHIRVHRHDIIKEFAFSALNQYFTIFFLYVFTLICTLFIWISITFLAAHVKTDGIDMKYVDNRWIRRNTQTRIEMRNEIVKDHIIINKDEVIQLKNFIKKELENLSSEIYNLFSNAIMVLLFKDLIKNIQNEIDATIIKNILPYQSINEFGHLTSKMDLMEQWYNLSSHKVQKPLMKLKSKVTEHLSNEKSKSDCFRISLIKNFTKWKRLFRQIELKWTQLFQKIEDETYSKLDKIETNVEIFANQLRAIIWNPYTINVKVSKQLENALVELELYAEQEVNNLSTYMPFKKEFDDMVQNINLSSDKSMLKFVHRFSNKSFDEHLRVLIDKTFKEPLASLKNACVVYVFQQKNLAGPQQLENLNDISNRIIKQFLIFEGKIRNKEMEIRRRLTVELQQDEESQVAIEMAVNSQYNRSQENETLQEEIINLRKENNDLNEKLNLQLEAVEKIIERQNQIDIEVGGEEKKEK